MVGFFCVPHLLPPCDIVADPLLLLRSPLLLLVWIGILTALRLVPEVGSDRESPSESHRDRSTDIFTGIAVLVWGLVPCCSPLPLPLDVVDTLRDGEDCAMAAQGKADAHCAEYG